MIFVVMRYMQLGSILDALRVNPTRNIVFVGNNVRSAALAASLPEKNVLFAFASLAGHRERGYVASVDLKKITIGQLSVAPSNEKLIGQIFDGTKYKVTYEPNMGGLPSLPRGIRAAGSLCLLQSGRRSEKAQGEHGLFEPFDRRQH